MVIPNMGAFIAWGLLTRVVHPDNLYNVQHESTHLVGTSRGSSDDMRECLRLSATGALDPSLMVTRVGGLNAVPDALLGLPSFIGGKILVYPHVEMDLTAIENMAARATKDERFAALAQICAANHNIWKAEAEKYVLDTLAARAWGEL